MIVCYKFNHLERVWESVLFPKNKIAATTCPFRFGLSNIVGMVTNMTTSQSASTKELRSLVHERINKFLNFCFKAQHSIVNYIYVELCRNGYLGYFLLGIFLDHTRFCTEKLCFFVFSCTEVFL